MNIDPSAVVLKTNSPQLFFPKTEALDLKTWALVSKMAIRSPRVEDTFQFPPNFPWLN